MVSSLFLCLPCETRACRMITQGQKSYLRLSITHAPSRSRKYADQHLPDEVNGNICRPRYVLAASEHLGARYHGSICSGDARLHNARDELLFQQTLSWHPLANKSLRPWTIILHGISQNCRLLCADGRSQVITKA